MGISNINPDREFLLSHIKFDKKIIRAQGHYVYDEEGTAYLDFLAQYGAMPFGHNPSFLWDAIAKVRSRNEPSLVQPLISPAAEILAKELLEVSPCGPGFVTFTNSGAETVEAAIKLARAKTGKPVILSTINGFHGKTLGALSATGRPVYKEPFRIDTNNFIHVPYGDLEALEARLSEGDIAGFIVEPIQGEAGMITPPEGYLAAASEICRKSKVLFILDEIQTGMGRTGTLFAADGIDNIHVDMLLLAKALGGGLVSLGACVCSEKAWSTDFGTYHSSTFGNNHLSCSVGLATLRYLTEDNGKFIRNVKTKGHYLQKGLQRLVALYPNAFCGVSGEGLMQGLRLSPWNQHDSYFLSYLSSTATAVPLVCGHLLAEHNILTAPVFNNGDVLRIEPPLTITREEIRLLLMALEEIAKLITDGEFLNLFGYIVGLNDVIPINKQASNEIFDRRVSNG